MLLTSTADTTTPVPYRYLQQIYWYTVQYRTKMSEARTFHLPR